MALFWNCEMTCGISGVMRLTIASIDSMRDCSIVSSAAPSRRRLSTNAAMVVTVSAATSAWSDSWPMVDSSMTPGQRSNSATVIGVASAK